MGGGDPFLPAVGTFCPPESKAPDVRSSPPSTWEAAALACSNCCKSEEDPKLEMVILFSFEEAASSLAPTPAPSVRRGRVTAKNMPLFSLLRDGYKVTEQRYD